MLSGGASVGVNTVADTAALRANAKLLVAQYSKALGEQFAILIKLDWEESKVKPFLEAGHTVTMKEEHSWHDYWIYYKIDDGPWFDAESIYPEGVPEDISDLDWQYHEFVTVKKLKKMPLGSPSGTEITRFSK